jgi:hypothetical protein
MPGYEFSCLGKSFHAWVRVFMLGYEFSCLGMSFRARVRVFMPGYEFSCLGTYVVSHPGMKLHTQVIMYICEKLTSANKIETRFWENLLNCIEDVCNNEAHIHI